MLRIDTSLLKVGRFETKTVSFSFTDLSFLSPWFPWTWLGFTGDWVVGLHLMVSLCFYDGLFTFGINIININSILRELLLS